MEVKRKAFQGVSNIIRFNWHFYLIASIIFLFLFIINAAFPTTFQNIVFIGMGFAVFSVFMSLLISFWIYDLSDLYELKWIKNANNKKLLNINAGFDETSEIILRKFPKAELTICDFYNPNLHTEISIKRARKAYPLDPKTIEISTDSLPFLDNYFDESFAILSAHEIRNSKERITFFKELKRVTNGRIYVTEHLRDWNNFLAYTFGFFHFHSKKEWLKTFTEAGLSLNKELKTTPFITTFILEKNGNTI